MELDSGNSKFPSIKFMTIAIYIKHGNIFVHILQIFVNILTGDCHYTLLYLKLLSYLETYLPLKRDPYYIFH